MFCEIVDRFLFRALDDFSHILVHKRLNEKQLSIFLEHFTLFPNFFGHQNCLQDEAEFCFVSDPLPIFKKTMFWLFEIIVLADNDHDIASQTKQTKLIAAEDHSDGHFLFVFQFQTAVLQRCLCSQRTRNDCVFHNDLCAQQSCREKR